MNPEFFTPIQIFMQVWFIPLLILAPLTVFRALILSQ